jgi:hypothetical protein
MLKRITNGLVLVALIACGEDATDGWTGRNVRAGDEDIPLFETGDISETDDIEETGETEVTSRGLFAPSGCAAISGPVVPPELTPFRNGIL